MKTLKQKIEVMTAADRGARIQMKPYGLPDNYWTPAPFECTWNWSTLDYRIAVPDIAPGHNPDRLTTGQVETHLGWRLLEPDEIKSRSYEARQGNHIEMWISHMTSWDRCANGACSDYCYRTKLTREQLAALDSPPPKRHLPLGPKDFPPGTVVRCKHWTSYSWKSIIAVALDSIVMYNSQTNPQHLSQIYTQLIESWERSLDGGKTWLPCYREQ